MSGTWKIGALCGAIVGSLLVFAPIASAHHPVVVASLACSGTVTFTITADIQNSTRNNSDVELTDTSGATQPVQTGAFNRANNWSFSGTYVIPTTVTSDTLTPQAHGIWGDGAQASNGPSTTITRPTNCPPTTPGPPPTTTPTTTTTTTTTAPPAAPVAPAKTSAAPPPVPAPLAAPSHPAIAISKSPKTQTIPSGSSAAFTIAVTNTGDVPLTNVFVTDALSPDCVASASTIAELSSLGPGASVTYTCTTANVTANFTNVATDTGTPPIGPNVTATDTAAVVVTAPFLPPSVSVVKPSKSGHPTVAPASGSSSYSLTVSPPVTAPFTPPTVRAPKLKLVGHVAPTTTG
jgi:uncharacterized repeat protein (TIGR01451 family)